VSGVDARILGMGTSAQQEEVKLLLEMDQALLDGYLAVVMTGEQLRLFSGWTELAPAGWGR
jgi:hypothetical protein